MSINGVIMISVSSGQEDEWKRSYSSFVINHSLGGESGNNLRLVGGVG